MTDSSGFVETFAAAAAEIVAKLNAEYPEWWNHVPAGPCQVFVPPAPGLIAPSGFYMTLEPIPGPCPTCRR